MLARKYEMFYRNAYELRSVPFWLGAAGALAASPAITGAVCGAGMVASVSMAVRRAMQGRQVLIMRAALAGKAMQAVNLAKFDTLTTDPDRIFLGYGFEWTPTHSQRLYELAKVDYRDYAVSPWQQRLLGLTLLKPDTGNDQPDKEIGLPYLHGVEPNEQPIYRPLQNFEGGTLIVGTTQAGKGVALATLITQAVKRGDIVIVIDPKNSQRLRRVVELACKRYRDPDTFLFFHPSFPDRGVRIDFTYNWQKPTEIASRVQSVMPANTEGAFTAFGWDAVNVVVGGLVDLEERPNLIKLNKYIEGGIEPILEQILPRHFTARLGDNWRNLPRMRTLFDQARAGKLKTPSPVATQELTAMIEFYERGIFPDLHDKVIDSAVRVFRHNREHYQKITANLLPVLSMLTSGDLGRTLSPDPFDMADKRPIMNFPKIEEGGHVLYMCLDSLPDASVATAIGGLALADLAARAGMRYNLGLHRRIALFVDEASNVINRPLIEIMNKGAEGGIYTTLAMQTLSDLAEKLGSEDGARMALGNLNNLIAFRSKDRPTQDFIVETFGQTAIHSVRVGQNMGMDGHVGDFSSGESTQLTEGTEDLIPAAMLGRLPNLQYFALLSGGRPYKGRFTLLDVGAIPPQAPLGHVR